MSRICLAGGTIRVARFVRILDSDNNSVVECNRGEQPIGISTISSREAPLPSVTADPPEAAQSGDSLEIHDFNTGRQDISLRIGTGGCAPGDYLIPDDDGNGVVGFGPVGAVALESASAGELCPVLLLQMPQCGVPFVPYEFDTQADADALSHMLIPAVLNKTGLVIMGVWAIVTEVFGGASEDQGIVTVEDTDGTDIATLTPTNAGADALNDIIIGYSGWAASTGAAAKIVAADKGVRGIVTQATSGASAAGKMRVFVQAFPNA